ncbi:MAG: lysophospholipid acyltransferase family protein [Chloroflexota bacterium]|nr:lysophospholipid acyltransferase family protein [Chloroflexota bacterium]
MSRAVTLLTWHGWQRLDAVLPRAARFSLATVVGELLYWVLPHKRAAVLENMTCVLGPDASPAAVRHIARRSFRNFAKYLAEFTHLPRWTAPDLERLIASATGWEHVDDAVSDGKGVIFVTPHFGNWDIAAWYFGQRYPFAAVVEPLRPPELDALVQGWRRMKHIQTIPLAGAVRQVLRLLHQGGLVGLVVDRPTHAQENGVAVRFFGEYTRVPAGAARFALRTGAPVVASGVWRTPQNTYTAFALPPLRFTPSGTPHERDTDEAQAMQRIMDDIETIIRQHPDQWYMFRRMWPQPSRYAPWPASRPVATRPVISVPGEAP